MVCLMDGRRTMDEIWAAVARKAGDEPPTQDETIQLMAQLHSSDLLLSELPPDLQELAKRSDRQQRRDLLLRIRNPLSLRLPIVDPDHWLDMTMPLVRPFFTFAGFVAWCALVGTGLVLLVLHWPELTSDVTDRVLASENIAIVFLVYPVIKLFHEMGHAYAVKRWGGAVHEVGLMLLIFIPVAYVDASSSTAFVQKHRRIVVGAAGILVELALAAIAMIVWVNASPGIVRIVCFNVMLIGSVSTLVFNGNPLLRFDGYYILSDLLEIPNLGSRASQYVLYLVQHYALGIASVDDPSTARSERGWLVFYALASFLYRLLVTFGIAMFLASKFFFFGAALAIFAVISAFMMPIAKGLRFLVYDRRLSGSRKRALATVAAATAALACALFLVPLPYAAVSEGVVWLPDQAEVRAATSGIVQRVVAEDGQTVAPGQLLATMTDPIIASQLAVREAQLRELRERRFATSVTDRVQTEILDEQIRHIVSSLELLRSRAADLFVKAPLTGRFVATDRDDLVGRFVKKGDIVGYLLNARDTTIRTIISQSDLDLVRKRLKSVQVRFAAALSATHPAHISREVPGGVHDVPSLALTTLGGGSIAIDPSSKAAIPQALFNLFQVDVALNDPTPTRFAGQHAWVRFGFGYEPIAWRIVRGLRLTFLSHFHV